MPSFAQAPSHDPSNIMKDGDRYWVFNTSVGIGAISADNPDFKNWQAESSVFPSGTWPEWINDYVPDFAGQFWAPAAIYMNDQYYIYYSCSTMGSSLSAIGLVTTPSLNNPEWTDQGVVVTSDGSGTGTLVNAIDPAIFKDDDGSLWMVYGSWFGGIAIIELDPESGKAIGSLTNLVGGNHTDIEASYLLKHEDYYYLFVNRANCCKGVNSTYYIQVGRSTNVTGPYSDYRIFLENNDGRFIGPGHVGYQQDRLTYHVYDRDDNGRAKMMSTTMDWVDGWPVPGEVDYEWDGTRLFNGKYKITAVDSSKVVWIDDALPQQGSNVEIKEILPNSFDGQTWTLNNTFVNNYQVSPADSTGFSFDIYNCLPDDGANLGIWSYWGGKCQQWYFKDMGNDLYQIKSVLTNKNVEIAGQDVVNGANLYLTAMDTINPNQLFRVQLIEPGGPMISSFSDQQAENLSGNLIDGDSSDESRWSAETFPQSVVIDYGKVKPITGVKVWTYLDRAYQYTVELSEDSSFSAPYVIDRSSNSDAGQPISDHFDAVSARYARLTVTGATGYTGTWVSITEFAIVEMSTSTDDIQEIDESFSIYPNPANASINIKVRDDFKNHSTLTIYNSIGNTIYTQVLSSASLATIDISDFHSGMYIVTMAGENGISTSRFMKVRR